MLNELRTLERGLTGAGYEIARRHADMSSPRRMEALHVRLDEKGTPFQVATIHKDRVASLWTLRNGKHNSFPYVQLKRPLLAIPDNAAWRKSHGDTWKTLVPAAQRQHLRDLARDYAVSSESCAVLTGSGLRESLIKRRSALAVLGEPHASVPAVVERVLAVGSSKRFADAVLALLLAGLDQGDAAFLEAAHVVLVGRVDQGKVTGCPFLLDVMQDEFARDVADPRHAAAISQALSGDTALPGKRGMCFLAGAEMILHAGNFPQPTVPVLGQIYLFSKNGDIAAAHRYGRADIDGLPIGSEVSQRLAGALDAITGPDLKGKTWRDVPGEKPKSRDLLIAFVERVPHAPVATLLASDDATDEDDPLAEETDHLSEVDRRAAADANARAVFLVRTQRVLDAVKGKVGVDFRGTPVAMLVLRKVDIGNAKAILHRALTVGSLHDAAIAWAEALDNLPSWLRMPVPQKNASVRNRRAPPLSPLQLPRALRALFIRGGTERAGREPVGLTAADALALFLGEAGADQIAQGALGTVLVRQGLLLAGAAQALRRDVGQDGLKAALKFDRGAALQAAGLTGLLLARIGRKRETYMSSAAFQLGQVLAAADVIHVGYCADVRGGQIPVTLLGNSVLTIAQDDPCRALALLCRRLGPYLTWARGQADWNEADKLIESGKAKAKGWAIKQAISHHHRIKSIADALGGNLPAASDIGDEFRAELLLGYVAGLPSTERENKTDTEKGAQ